ncbi:MAG: O-antigen ligase family protein [Aggregatilineales bacterium]
MLGAVHHLNRSVQTIIGRARYYLLDRYHILTVRGLLIAVCLALTALTAVLLQERRIAAVGVVAGFAGLAFAVFAYRHMELMCLAVLAVSTVFDLGISSGTGTDIKLALVLLVLLIGLWAFRLFVVERSVAGVQGKWVIAPALLFALAVVISLVWSMYYVVPSVRPLMFDKLLPRAMTGLVLIVSPLTTLLFANHLRSAHAFTFIVGWFAFVGALKLPFAFIDAPLLPGLVNTGGQFTAWVGLLAAGQVLLNRRMWRAVRVALLLLIAGWVYVAVGMRFNWLSGWVPLVAGLSVVLALRFPRPAVAAGVVALVLIVANFSAVQEAFADESAQSGVTRVAAYDRTLQIVRDHYLFGTGPAGYYFYLTIYIGGLFQLSHNNYLDILAQTGLFGLAMYLWLWAGIGWYVLRAYQSVPRGGFYHGLAASLCAAYVISLGAMMLGDWVTPFTYTQTLSGISYTIWHWVLAGAAIALYCQAQRLAPAAKPAEGQALAPPSAV